MNISKIFLNLLKNKYSQVYTVLFFVLLLFIGLSIFKDYGLSTDEPFHRTIGYYWYISLLEIFSNNYELIEATKEKFNAMYWSDYLNDGKLIQYGIFFDTITAFIEEILIIEETKNAFYLKHISTFLFFFLSTVFFYKIINLRFNNHLFSILITFFYISSPRIFAESFYNGKDIVFMSLIVCSLYYALKSFNKINYKNIILFSIFSAFATNIRVMGILIFSLFLFFLFLNFLEEKNLFKKNVLKFLVLIFLFPSIVFLFWPFLWGSPIDNFIFTIKSFANYDWIGSVLYLGDYYKGYDLPWHYIPVWIIATTPIIFSLIFFIGFIIITIRFSKNFLNLSTDNKMWKDSNQQKDFFILIFFITPIFLVIFLNSTLYTGWRHLYFIYPCIIYFIGIGLKFLLEIKINNFYKKSINSIIALSLIINSYNIIKLHPYQNVYFNILFEKKANKLFEIDYWGLGNKEALEFLLNEKKGNGDIDIKLSSSTPLAYSKLLLDKSKIDKFSFIGTLDKDQTYIFTNYIFQKNPNFEKKYSIPNNYDKIYSLKRGNIVINEIFEKK